MPQRPETQGPSSILLDFLMGLVLAAVAAELLQLDPLGGGLLVLGAGIVAVFALHALERNDISRHCLVLLLYDFRYRAGAHRAAALANREAQPLVHGDGRDQLHRQVHVVARHHHLRALRQLRHPRHVRRAEVELRPVSLEERRVPPSLFLAQHVHPPVERRVRRDRPRLGNHLPALHFVLFHAPQQQAHVVPSHPFIQQLLEHFHARHHRLARLAEADNFHFLADFALAPLDAPRHHRPTALYREDVLDRHQERLVQHALRYRNVAVHRVHQLQYALLPLRLPVQRPQRRYPDHRYLVARKLVELQQIPHFQLHQLQQLRIVHHVHFVQTHHDVRHPYLPRQQDVLPRLRHGPVGGRHHHDGAIHLRRPGDHVLDVVRVPRAIHVRVVPLGGLVFDVRHGDGDAAGLLFGRVVDGVEAPELDLGVVLAQHLRDGRRQGGLAVIDVPDRPDIYVRLAAVEFFLCHNDAFSVRNSLQGELWSG